MASAASVGGMILAAAGVLLAFFLVRGIYWAFFDPLAKVPGPKLWAFSDLFFSYYTLRGVWPYKLKELHDKYGPVVRTTPKDVSFIKPGAWKTIYGHRSNQDAFLKDNRFYRPSVSGHHHIVSAQGDDHKRHRKLLGYAFSDKAVRAQEDIIQGYVSLMINKLTERAKTTGMADMVQWFNFVTFDLVGDLAFGQNFGNLKKGQYHAWVSTLFESLQGMALSQVVSRYRSLARFVPKRFANARKQHWDLANHTARKRLEDRSNSREDFMSHILRHNEDDEKGGMTVEEMVENSYILVVAGSETTGTLLAGTMYHLLMNPVKYEKLVAEVRSLFKKEGDITTSTILDLEYMAGVLEEGMRIYPPVPVTLPRITPPKGEFVEGYWIPGGTGVGIAQWAACHNESNFRDPFKFVPERWMGDSAYQDDIRDVVQGFSFGPRNCLGRKLAQFEMRLILARLLWNFDFEIMPDSHQWTEQKIYTLSAKPPLNVKITLASRE